MIMISLGHVVEDEDFMHFYGITSEKLEELKQSGLKDGFFMYGDDYRYNLIYSRAQQKVFKEKQERKAKSKPKTKKNNYKKVKNPNLPKIDIPVLTEAKRFIFTDKVDFKEFRDRKTYRLFAEVHGKEYLVTTFCEAMEMSRVHLINNVKHSETFKLNGVPVKLIRRDKIRIMYNLRNNKTTTECNHIPRSAIMNKLGTSTAIFQGLNEANPRKVYKNYTIERILV